MDEILTARGQLTASGQIIGTRLTRERSSSIHEQGFDHIIGGFAIAVGAFLTRNTSGCPWHCDQPLRADVFFAIQADSKDARLDPMQRGPRFPQKIGLTGQGFERQLTLDGVLDLIECVGTGFNGGGLTVADESFQFGLAR